MTTEKRPNNQPKRIIHPPPDPASYLDRHGTPHDGFYVEYTKRTDTIRIFGWMGSVGVCEALVISRAEFMERLGIPTTPPKPAGPLCGQGILSRVCTRPAGHEGGHRR